MKRSKFNVSRFEFMGVILQLKGGLHIVLAIGASHLLSHRHRDDPHHSRCYSIHLGLSLV